MYKILRWLRTRTRTTIEFTCPGLDFGAVAQPVPANKVMPAWYRNLQPVDPATVTAENNGFTVKKCMPFLDAMTQGWIMPVPVDIRVELSANGSTAKTSVRYPAVVTVSSHLGYQVAGSQFADRVILKLMMPWSIRTAPGYSCLFTPPLNRPADFVVLSGVVDTDKYFVRVNLPIYFTRPDGVFVLEKGTPLAQVIPFRRETFHGEVREMTEHDALTHEKQLRVVMSETGWYRNFARAKR